MPTKYLDNKGSTFRILLSWCFPRKTALWDDFLVCPQCPPIQKHTFNFVVVSPSLRHTSAFRTRVFRGQEFNTNFFSQAFRVPLGPKCTTASQPQSLAIFWIAGEIARNFRSAQQILPFFIAKQNASQPQPYRYRREIATSFPERSAAYSLTA